MATFKSFVIFTAAVFCCLVVQYIDATTTGPTTGALLQPCSDIPWNETFLDKVYYILHSEDPETYTYSNVNSKCKGIGIQKLVVNSLAENDFIVEMMKKYQPDIESRVFLACPSNTGLSFRRFNCRESEAIYEEETNSSQGFWNWRGGMPASDSGNCILLDTVDGAWSVSECGSLSNFLVCQCRRGIPAGSEYSVMPFQGIDGRTNSAAKEPAKGAASHGALLQPCSDIPWNETFLDKVYYILHSDNLTTYKYNNVATTCVGIGIQKLVVDSLAENDFIVEMMKKYRPGIESKVFLACPSDANRTFNCRDSEAFYKEETNSSQGFWNWRGGKPTIESGYCVLLDTVDGAWSASNCGHFSNFVICQRRRGIPAAYVSTRFHERSFGSRTCLKSELTMRMVSVDNFIKCAMECQSDGHCASFNLRTQHGITSPLICQLSLYHSSIVPDTKFIRDRNCKYYERVR
eukprot:XP_011677508.1 PREDICTED: uncharacterized protein LOC105444673 [Strongylocentrotus purpuratus]